MVVVLPRSRLRFKEPVPARVVPGHGILRGLLGYFVRFDGFIDGSVDHEIRQNLSGSLRVGFELQFKADTPPPEDVKKVAQKLLKDVELSLDLIQWLKVLVPVEAAVLVTVRTDVIAVSDHGFCALHESSNERPYAFWSDWVLIGK